MVMVLMMMTVILNGIEITNSKADSMKVDFSDRMKASSNLKLPNLGPGVCRRTEEKHLQGKARHCIISQRIPPQYLISLVILIILSSSHYKLLFEETSFESTQRPGKNLLWPEQHFWNVQTSGCICTIVYHLPLAHLPLTILTHLPLICDTFALDIWHICPWKKVSFAIFHKIETSRKWKVRVIVGGFKEATQTMDFDFCFLYRLGQEIWGKLKS